MMMPANFSAIAENEMTYVVGGGLIDAIGAVTAPVWTAANVKTFNTNLVQIIGNSYINPVISGTLGVMFSGTWGKKTGAKYGDKNDKNVRNNIFGKHSPNGLWAQLDPTDDGETSGLNKFMQGIGALAAVYQLGTVEAKTVVGEANPITTLGVSDTVFGY